MSRDRLAKPTTSVIKRTRQRHAKSRAGCRTCKARKIKCDEAKLECRNCIRFGIACDFLPRADWSSWAAAIDSREDTPLDDGPRVQLLPAEVNTNLSSVLSVNNLELFHHYITVAAATIGDAKLWQDEAPKLGREYPCIFHVMLSLSGHHLARIRPGNSARYLLLAEHHYEAAVRKATRMLPHLDINNCQALYIVTVLICFTAFARGPTPGDMLLVARDGLVPWLSLLRGVRLVLETIGSATVLSGILAPASRLENADQAAVCKAGVVASPLSSCHRQWDWRKTLEAVRELARECPDPAVTDMYDKEIKSLIRCFETTFGPGCIPRKCSHGQVHVVMAWVYALDPNFLEKLVQKDRVALILLGHFAILGETLERYWFIEGWGGHILREVKQALGKDYDVLPP